MYPLLDPFPFRAFACKHDFFNLLSKFTGARAYKRQKIMFKGNKIQERQIKSKSGDGSSFGGK